MTEMNNYRANEAYLQVQLMYSQSFFYDDLSGCVISSPANNMPSITSIRAEMILDNGNEQIHVGKGECVFIPLATITLRVQRRRKMVNATAVSS